MRITSTAVRLLSGIAAVAVLGAAAACGGSPADDAADNPYHLLQPGTLRVGTLTDAPPNVYLKDGRFTGFDNDLMAAMAEKLGLKVEFVGTEFSALLAQVNNRKFDAGSSSITITEERKKTVDFTNGYDFGYFGLDVPAGSPIRSFADLKGKRVVVVQGTVQDDYATKEGLDPVRVPDYNGAINQLKAKTADAWIAPAEIGEKSAQDSGGKIVLVEKQLSPAPTAFAVAKGNDALREALNRALDQVIQDGTWTRLQEQYYPGRPIPETFRPGSGTVTFPPVRVQPSGTPTA
ncbi:ABC transporter substrate-binding protein [Micromonospora sp. HM5-17]|jgi:polar amino acid transport system substrate-binding protein|uniref:ABC transporter substrate-binding protein n=1 Tax=Micromonospora sp. HM5-17 TaxID=2487710 RepID=UPI000F474B36|nr:ABC transporter substrate-binding protein [Micromonospora sp. HM5-17]ROT33200.1 amino acid ABC transporter substrate-binding protein [Micromonospora sp. HM5-17]